MIVAMQAGASEEEIQAIVERMTEIGFNVHRTTGTVQTILAGVGTPGAFAHEDFEVLAGVAEVIRISSPYKLAGRSFRPEGTVVRFPNGVSVGGEEVVVMAGPCSVESREQIFESARLVNAAGAKFLRGGAFKPRSSPYSFQGLGLEALKLLREAGDAHGLLIVSEVMEISQIELMMPYGPVPGGRAQYAELQFAARAGGSPQAGAAEARDSGDDRGDAALGGVSAGRGELRRDPVRARHSDV
jgi:3-deoxy-7-phosphoheptulonate synthase